MIMHKIKAAILRTLECAIIGTLFTAPLFAYLID